MYSLCCQTIRRANLDWSPHFYCLTISFGPASRSHHNLKRVSSGGFPALRLVWLSLYLELQATFDSFPSARVFLDFFKGAVDTLGCLSIVNTVSLDVIRHFCDRLLLITLLLHEAFVISLPGLRNIHPPSRLCSSALSAPKIFFVILGRLLIP